MKTEYDVGDKIILQVRYFDRVGTPTNPTDAHVYVRTPDGIVAEVTPFAVTADTGVYEASYTIAQEGKHWWREVSTGAVATAEERWFNVRQQQVTPP